MLKTPIRFSQQTNLQLFARGLESKTEIFMHSKLARDSRRSGRRLRDEKRAAAAAAEAEVGKGA